VDFAQSAWKCVCRKILGTPYLCRRFVARVLGPCLLGPCLLVPRSPFQFSSLHYLGRLSPSLIRGGDIYYRRLFKWTAIRENEIVSGTAEWPGVIGFLGLTRPMFPWGRLYFVLDAKSDPNPFHKGEYPLLRGVN
jgi:hypothetical protein